MQDTAAVMAPMTGGIQAYTYFALILKLFSRSLVIIADKPDSRKIHSRILPFKKS